MYLTKWFAITERVKLRFDTQFFNVLDHPNFGLPNMVLAGIPGKPSTQTGFGALTYTTSRLRVYSVSVWVETAHPA